MPNRLRPRQTLNTSMPKTAAPSRSLLHRYMTSPSTALLFMLLAQIVGPSSAFVNYARITTLTSTSALITPLKTADKTCTSSITTQLSNSPSGIDELPILAQAATFIGVYGALGIGTAAGSKGLDILSTEVFGLERWRGAVIETFLPGALGSVYLLAGAGHFLAADAFCNIYPPQGTWGFWYLPGSASFHVAWTGCVEVLGGLGLWWGVFRSMAANNDDGDEEEEGNLIPRLVQPISALTLFALTCLVTPANIYMFTHGATFGPDMPPLGLQFHLTRFAIQVQVLSLLLALAKDSFFFAWGDELD